MLLSPKVFNIDYEHFTIINVCNRNTFDDTEEAHAFLFPLYLRNVAGQWRLTF